MNKSDHIDQLAKALSAVQKQVKPVAFNAVNPFLKNKYADLGAVIEACKQALCDNGFAVTQLATNDGGIGVETVLMHESGQWISSTISLPLGDEKGKSLAQVAGSIITYLRRYALAAIVGLYADEDGDGNAANQQQSSSTQKSHATASPISKPWYENALDAVRAKSSVWEKPLGATPHGNAFITKLLSDHIGEGQWWEAKPHFLNAVNKYTGFKTPEEMSWVDASNLIRIETGQRAKKGDIIAHLVWQGIFSAEQWSAICDASGLKLTDVVDTDEKEALLRSWFKSMDGADISESEYAVIGGTLAKIMGGK